MIHEFVKIYDSNHMTVQTWNQIAKRLEKDVVNEYFKNDRYDGIIHYLIDQSDNIDDEIEITSSSVLTCNGESFSSENVILYDDPNEYFASENKQDSWLCFEFKNHRLKLARYEIMSHPFEPGYSHAKNFIIEGSNDNVSWTPIHEVVNANLYKNLVLRITRMNIVLFG